MLVKRPDGWASATRALPQESIYSGLTLEEIRTGSQRAAEVRAELERLGAPRHEVRAGGGEAHARGDGGEGLHRPRLALRAEVRRLPRPRRARGRRHPPRLPAGQRRDRHLPGRRARARRRCPSATSSSTARWWSSTTRAGRASSACSGGRSSDGPPTSSGPPSRCRPRTTPSTSSAFEGFDLRPLPLVERKRLLQMLLPRAGPVRFLDHVPEQGEAFYAEVSRLKLEGLIAKRGRRAVPPRPLAALAEAAHGARGRLRGRGLHGAAGRAAPASARCTSPPSRARRSSTAAGPAAASARSSSSPCARRSRPSGGRRRPARARCRPTAATSGSSRGSWPRCAT